MRYRLDSDGQGSLYSQKGRPVENWDSDMPVFMLGEQVGMRLPNADEIPDTV